MNMKRDTKIHTILTILVDECMDPFPKKWSKERKEKCILDEIHKAEVLIDNAYKEK